MTWCKASGNPDKWTQDSENYLVPLLLKNETFWQIYVATPILGALSSRFLHLILQVYVTFFYQSRFTWYLALRGSSTTPWVDNTITLSVMRRTRLQLRFLSLKFIGMWNWWDDGLNITSLNFGNVFCIFFLTSISHCAYCLALKLCCLIKFSLSIYVVSK